MSTIVRRPTGTETGDLYNELLKNKHLNPEFAPELRAITCDTVATLRMTKGDLAGNAGPRCVILNATATPGDGGAGVFYWHNTIAATDDNGANYVQVIGPDGNFMKQGAWVRVTPEPGVPTVIASSAFSASSVAVSWTAGAYRRLELHLRVTTSGAGNGVVTLTGLGGTYSSWCTYNQSGVTTWGGSTFPATWALGDAANVGQTDATFQIANGGLRTFTSTTLDASAPSYLLLSQGSNTDTTTDVTGMTLTFPGATSGWFELLGFA